MITVNRTGDQDYGEKLTMALVGGPGKGKTRFAATAKNPYFLNAEGGLMSIAAQQIPYTTIESTSQLLEIMTFLSTHGRQGAKDVMGIEIDTVVIDTFDEIQRILIRERLDATRQTELKPGDWTWVTDQMSCSR